MDLVPLGTSAGAAWRLLLVDMHAKLSSNPQLFTAFINQSLGNAFGFNVSKFKQGLAQNILIG